MGDGFKMTLDLESMTSVQCACGTHFEFPAWVFKLIKNHATMPRCAKCTEIAKAEALAREPAERQERRDAAFDDRLPPLYQGTSFEQLYALPPDERRRRCKDATGIDQAKAAVRSSWVVLAGPAGVGKTVLATCIGREWARASDQRTLFVDGFALATARAQEKLGNEAPVVENALRVSQLIIDDLCARPSNALFDASSDVIHARHQYQRRTIFTVGHDPGAIAARLGDGIARRIYEAATIIELKPKASR
jgi:DNA replication protein DnaC